MKQTKLALIGLLTILVVLLLTSNNANPDAGPIYGLKRFQEKTFLNLQFSPKQKLDYLNSLLSKRLSEVEYLTNNQKTYMLWTSSLRYSTTAGEISDLILANNLEEEAIQQIKRFKKDQEKINNLLTYYPGDLDPTERNSKFLTDAINYLRAYIEKLSQIN